MRIFVSSTACRRGLAAVDDAVTLEVDVNADAAVAVFVALDFGLLGTEAAALAAAAFLALVGSFPLVVGSFLAKKENNVPCFMEPFFDEGAMMLVSIDTFHYGLLLLLTLSCSTRSSPFSSSLASSLCLQRLIEWRQLPLLLLWR